MTVRTIGIVGAGIIGLAVARRIQQTTDAHVTVLDKEDRVAAHQTGHNSNVVHSGVYYAPGSLKATLTRRGVGLLRAYCEEHELAFHEVGKVIVAATDDEVGRLHELVRRAQMNGVPGTQLLSAPELREREPHIRGKRALFVPSTAVVDYPRICEQLARDVRNAGGEVLLAHGVEQIQETAGRVSVTTQAGTLVFDQLIVCAGLQSARLARAAGASTDPEIVPFRGEYYELRPDRGNLVNGLVYPVPDPNYPFLGVHFTPSVNGPVHVGPNAVPALALEGYTWTEINLPELVRSLTYPGMLRLARANIRMGAGEIVGSLMKSTFLRRAQVYLPDLELDDLVRSPAGVRAQAVNRDGTLVDDFVIEQRGKVTFVRNAPSPAATASFAIAEHIVDTVTGR